MTGKESRLLQVGTRVSWGGDRSDEGSITARDWSGVRIEWDKGLKTYIHQNNMKQVSVVPKN
jgi:hypothetical protein